MRGLFDGIAIALNRRLVGAARQLKMKSKFHAPSPRRTISDAAAKDFCATGQCNSLGDPMCLEPCFHPLPPVARLLWPIARTVVSIEAMRSIGINHDLGRFAGSLQFHSHLIDLRHRNCDVGSAVQAKNRDIDLSREIERTFWRRFGA